MSLSRMLLEVDEAGEGLATEIALQVNWDGVLAFNVPGHASAVHPGWTLSALHLALAWKAGRSDSSNLNQILPQTFRFKSIEPQLIFIEEIVYSDTRHGPF